MLVDLDRYAKALRRRVAHRVRSLADMRSHPPNAGKAGHLDNRSGRSRTPRSLATSSRRYGSATNSWPARMPTNMQRSPESDC